MATKGSPGWGVGEAAQVCLGAAFPAPTIRTMRSGKQGQPLEGQQSCPLPREEAAWLRGKPRLSAEKGRHPFPKVSAPRGLSTWEGTQAEALNVENIKVLQGQLYGVVDSLCHERARGGTGP